MKDLLRIREDVAHALATGQPVVALESTVIAHGLPHPRNLETALAMEAAVRREGAIPATIAIIDGVPIVGLNGTELQRMANTDGIAKISPRDFAPLISLRMTGATTVAGTLAIAAAAAILVLATGGIGGVHRGAETSFDISADLAELSRSPVGVVCSGAKLILDLPRTLEVLETLGVSLVGFRTSEFPAFYVKESGHKLEYRVDTPEQAACILRAQRALNRSAAVVFCNPPPDENALPRTEIEAFIARALHSAAENHVTGKDTTPFLLRELFNSSHGRTLETNIALLIDNATLAARIAVAYGRE
jgi:pseudouridine-5'-phosphate glycosidase